jgi:hypothetical protein
MANGVYGSMIPTMISDENISNYIDIYYSYSETRNSSDVDSSSFKRVDKNDITSFISTIKTGQTEPNSGLSNIIDGLYNLKLPASIFGKKGFYTIYIKPREVPVTILDVSMLKDFPSVRGVVLDIAQLPSEVKGDASVNNALVGYRLILLDNNGNRSNDIRIVTSNNKCQPITSVASTNSRSYSYQYNENSSFTFLTITPSTPLSIKANSTPYIGKATQKAYLVNTLFEPVCVEIEMVENDADTIANMLSGSQLRDLNNGLITTFDENNNIFMQHEMSTLKKTETGVPQYEIRENRKNNIDFSQTITDKLS